MMKHFEMGGAHATNNVEIQEFTIMPDSPPPLSVRPSAAVAGVHTLKTVLKGNPLPAW